MQTELVSYCDRCRFKYAPNLLTKVTNLLKYKKLCPACLRQAKEALGGKPNLNN